MAKNKYPRHDFMKFYKDPILILFIAILSVNLAMVFTMDQESKFQVQRTAKIESSVIKLERTIGEFIYLNEQADMWSGNQSLRNRVNGLYWSSNDYYCVWVKERGPLNIELTEQHEYCHSLIDLDNKTHFCKKT